MVILLSMVQTQCSAQHIKMVSGGFLDEIGWLEGGANNAKVVGFIPI